MIIGLRRALVATGLFLLATSRGEQQQCELGPDADTSMTCEKGEFCELDEGVCNSRSGVHVGVCAVIPEACFDLWEPVCGCNEKTYSNTCYAHADGFSVSRTGECDATPVVVGETVDLVDTIDLVSVEPIDAIKQCELGPDADTAMTCGAGEFCELDTGVCNSRSGVHIGICAAIPESCFGLWEPVCGCNEKTYSNECDAHADGSSVSRTGECDATPVDVVLTEPINATQQQMFADELTPLLYEKENECSSALGVSMAFSLIYPGSTGEGLDEIRDTLRYPEGSNMVLVWEETTQRMLDMYDGEDMGYAIAPLLQIANSVWFHDEDVLDSDYSDVVGGHAMQTDFKDDNSPIVVNEWVEKNTNGLIDSIVSEDQPLYPPYLLIAVNSIYLKATWNEQFNPSKTNLDAFYDSAARTTEASKAHFMHMVESLPYSHDALEGYQVIQLPFAASQMSMVFVLPTNDGGEEVSSTDVIKALDSNAMQSRRVALALPKFKFESEYDDILKGSLEDMGMKAPFTKGAGALCGLFEDKEGCEELVIEKVVQKTVIDVNEEGVEAAAVTAIGVGVTSIPTGDPIEMILDHPFQFFVYDGSEGLMLFEGRVGAPDVPDGAAAVPLDSKHADDNFWSTTFGVDPTAPPMSVTTTGSTAATVPTTALSAGGDDGADAEAAETTDADSTQPTEAAVSNDITEPTGTAASSETTTQPTEPDPIDPSESSSGVSNKQRYIPGAFLLLAFASVLL